MIHRRGAAGQRLEFSSAIVLVEFETRFRGTGKTSRRIAETEHGGKVLRQLFGEFFLRRNGFGISLRWFLFTTRS
jgi:hypothetical protein